MATRIYGVSVGDALVTEGVGSATAADTIELTVDLATTEVNDQSSTRAVTKNEVLQALDKIKDHILEGNWPPA